VASHISEGLLKPSVTTDKGLVVSKHPIASEIGAEILRRGGNAVDAVVATAFALGVVEPYMSGLGGVGIGLWWNGSEVIQIDGCTKTPKSLSVDSYPLVDEAAVGFFGWAKVMNDHNIHGPLSVGVPTIPAILSWIHAKGGSMPWAELIQPAIELARKGFPTDWLMVLGIVDACSLFQQYPTTADVFLPGGAVPRPGLGTSGPDKIVCADLARTLEMIASEGVDVLYKGSIGKQISDFIGSLGGYLSESDLAEYELRIGSPIHLELLNYDVWLSDGLNGGPTVAEILSMIGEHEVKRGQPMDVSNLVAWGRAGLLAFEDRLNTMGAYGPKTNLWAKEHVHNRMMKGFSNLVRGSQTNDSTTHLSVVDGSGYGVSLTMTLLSRWGSHLVVPGTGILLNNAIMWCDPISGRPNSLAPDTTPLANMAPIVVTRQGKLQGLIGSSGGRKIGSKLANPL
jgi:gamma-glutamyltranspeptidase / glutathione hydrolase